MEARLVGESFYSNCSLYLVLRVIRDGQIAVVASGRLFDWWRGSGGRSPRREAASSALCFCGGSTTRTVEDLLLNVGLHVERLENIHRIN